MSPFGLHWPDLDEDLSFKGMIKGDFGQHISEKPTRVSIYLFQLYRCQFCEAKRLS
ncbi:MAG: hypothetical protein AB1403_19585 [Candidatus Riflebacteria bacterium]